MGLYRAKIGVRVRVSAAEYRDVYFKDERVGAWSNVNALDEVLTRFNNLSVVFTSAADPEICELEIMEPGGRRFFHWKDSAEFSLGEACKTLRWFERTKGVCAQPACSETVLGYNSGGTGA